MDKKERTKRSNKKACSKPSKYNARSVDIDGHRFASQAEALRYGELTLLEKNGLIHSLRLHPRFVLLPAVKLPDGAKLGAVRYTADFQYYEDEKIIVEDVKGVMTRDAALRIHLFRRMYPEIDFRIIKARNARRSHG